MDAGVLKSVKSLRSTMQHSCTPHILFMAWSRRGSRMCTMLSLMARARRCDDANAHAPTMAYGLIGSFSANRVANGVFQIAVVIFFN